MRRIKQASEDEILFHYVSRKEGEKIETALYRDRRGNLDLFCARTRGGKTNSARICDMGKREESCLAFARVVAESHTDPRILLELWEEFEA